jgi:hypothetical protein
MLRGLVNCVNPPALGAGSNRSFQALDLYDTSPESGGLWYESRQFTEMFCAPFEGRWIPLFHKMYRFISFRTSNTPQISQLIILIKNGEQ